MLRLPRRHPPFSALVLSGAIGAATLLQGGTADAGRIHVGGRAHVSGRVSGRVHFSSRPYFSSRWRGPTVRYARPAWRPRVWVGGSVWVGGYYPRPYYHHYYPEYVPSYYGASYYPVQPAAAPGAVAVVAPRPRLPTFGLGVFAGGSSVEDRDDSSDLGALARFRLTPGLLIEGELGRTEYTDNVRVDRRLGGSLIYEIGAYNSLAPYVLAGAGVQQADVGGSYSTTQDFGEIGVGLRWAVARNLHLTLDVRAGRRETIASDQPTILEGAARTIAPPTVESNDGEDYTRGRLAAVVYF